MLIKVYEDKSYDWILKGPPSSWYIKQASGLARGADRPGHETVATISLKHLYEIAMVSKKGAWGDGGGVGGGTGRKGGGERGKVVRGVGGGFAMVRDKGAWDVMFGGFGW